MVVAGDGGVRVGELEGQVDAVDVSTGQVLLDDDPLPHLGQVRRIGQPRAMGLPVFHDRRAEPADREPRRPLTVTRRGLSAARRAVVGGVHAATPARTARPRRSEAVRPETRRLAMRERTAGRL